MTTQQLQTIARKHGTPVVVIDHDIIRKNYAEFKKHLPKVQCYFAVKANRRAGHRPHALPGRRELRRGVAAGVHAGL